MHHCPAVAYVPLVDAPAVTLSVVWREPAGHPAIRDFVALARDIVSDA